MADGKAVTVSELFASMVDTFLSDYVMHVAGGNREQAAINAARLAQVGMCISQYFNRVSSNLCLSEEEANSCNRASEIVAQALTRRLNQIFGEDKHEKGLPEPHGEKSARDFKALN